MSKTVVVALAHVDIIGGINLEARPIETVALAPGDHFQVKLLFNFAEKSTKRDDFRISLAAEFAGERPEPVVHAHKDRRGFADDQQGFIMQEFTAPKHVGGYLLTFVIEAELTVDGETVRGELDDQVPVQVA